MSTNNTYINALDDFVVKGNLTVEGNVTQVSTTINQNRVAAEEFIINSDGENTTAKLTLNSNNTLASLSFLTGGNMVVEPNIQGNIIIGAGQTLTVASGATISGNVFSGNLTGVASEATMFTDTVKIEIGGANASLADGTASATFQGAANVATLDFRLKTVNSNVGSWGNASYIPNFTVNGKGLITAAGESAVNITTSQISDHTTVTRGLFAGINGITYTSGDGNISLSDTVGASGVGTFGTATAVSATTTDRYGRITSISNVPIAITASQVTDFTTAAEALLSVTNASGDGSLAYNNTTGVFTYTGPSAAEVRAHFTGGTGIDISSGTVAIDNTVVQTTGTQTISGAKTFTGTVDLTGATIPGNVTFGNITVTNIDSATETDSVITAASLTLRQGASTGADAKILVERGSTGNDAYLQWNETTDRWQFYNGSADSNMLLLSDFSSGITSDIVTTGKILYSNVYSTEGDLPSAGTYHGMFAHVHGTGKGYFAHGGAWHKLLDESSSSTTNLTEGTNLYYTDERVDDRVNTLIVAGDGISDAYDDAAGTLTMDVDASVVRTTGNQSLAGDKTFTGKLIVPAAATTTANAIYSDANEAYIYINGVAKQITPTASVGSVEDVGSTGLNIYAGSRIAANVTYHGIKSIDGGTYTNVAEAGNVVTVEGDISAIRGAFSAVDNAGDGTFTYNSSTGQFSYSGVSQSQIRGQFSASGSTLSYDSGTGAFTSSADNYSSWSFDTETGSAETVTSGEEVTFTGGTGIDVTHSGNAITIVNTSTADITGVTAGTGLTGGGSSGAVTLTANATYIKSLFSASGDLSYNASSGAFSFSNDAGDIEGVTAGTGLTGGGTSGTVTLDVSGLTVSELAAGSLQTSGESFANNDTSLMTSAAIEDKILSYGYTTETGDITGVTAGAGLSGGGTSGAVSLDVIEATSSAFGGVKIGYTESGKNYPVELSSGKMFVNVPWVDTDTNTTYSAGTGLSLAGTTFSASGLGVTHFSGSAIQTSGESFGDNDTSFMTSAAIQDKIQAFGYSTTTGTVTSVATGDGITGGTITGSGTISVDLSSTAIFTSTNTASKAVVRDASGNFAANTITATATQAQYADLAERYEADADYEPGTVLIIGGESEVTISDEPGSYKVVGVVSTDPAYLMNSEGNGIPVALRGRVPCKVTGNVNKGDVIISGDTPGHGMVAADPQNLSPLQIIGRSLSSKLDAGPGIVEIIV